MREIKKNRWSEDNDNGRRRTLREIKREKKEIE